nr:uncharacterized protein LOC127305124 isoform X2 [Lolium perenne]
MPSRSRALLLRLHACLPTSAALRRGWRCSYSSSVDCLPSPCPNRDFSSRRLAVSLPPSFQDWSQCSTFSSISTGGLEQDLGNGVGAGEEMLLELYMSRPGKEDYTKHE